MEADGRVYLHRYPKVTRVPRLLPRATATQMSLKPIQNVIWRVPGGNAWLALHMSQHAPDP